MLTLLDGAILNLPQLQQTKWKSSKNISTNKIVSDSYILIYRSIMCVVSIILSMSMWVSGDQSVECSVPSDRSVLSVPSGGHGAAPGCSLHTNNN